MPRGRWLNAARFGRCKRSTTSSRRVPLRRREFMLGLAVYPRALPQPSLRLTSPPSFSTSPSDAESRDEQPPDAVHFNTEPLQSHISRRGARDDTHVRGEETLPLAPVTWRFAQTSSLDFFSIHLRHLLGPVVGLRSHEALSHIPCSSAASGLIPTCAAYS